VIVYVTTVIFIHADTIINLIEENEKGYVAI